MSAVFHIGLPKTASASLQQVLLPRLGRPTVINPRWTQRLTRDVADAVPASLPDDVILSDATLGDFIGAPPAVVADRLARLCGVGTVIYVRRDPVDLFHSVYRDRLLNGATHLRTYVNGRLPLRWPFSASQFYVNQYKAYRQRGLGFFAMIGVEAVRTAFERHFDVHVLDFEVLKRDSRLFTHGFAAACDVDFAVTLPLVNASSPSRIAEAIAPVEAIVSPRLVKQLTDFYTKPRLTPQQEQTLRLWSVRNADFQLAAPQADMPTDGYQPAASVSRPVS